MGKGSDRGGLPVLPVRSDVVVGGVEVNKKDLFLDTLLKKHGSIQEGLTKEYGISWRCECEKDSAMPCGPRLVDCFRRSGRLEKRPHDR